MKPDLEHGPDCAGQLPEIARRILRMQFTEFERNVPGVCAGFDAEALHDVRVAARRIRAALNVFRVALPTAFVRDVRRELRWMAEAAGRVRDLDVGIDRLRRWRGELSPRVQAGADVWISEFEVRRCRARSALLLRLGSRRHVRFRRRMRRILARPLRGTVAPSPAANRADHPASGIIRRRFRRAARTAAALDGQSPDAAFHDVRIRIKKLRYALEFLSGSHPGAGRRLGRRLIELQDILGRHQDAVMVCGLLMEPLRTKAGCGAGLERTRRALLKLAANDIALDRRDFLKARALLDAGETRKWIHKLAPRA